MNPNNLPPKISITSETEANTRSNDTFLVKNNGSKPATKRQHNEMSKTTREGIACQLAQPTSGWQGFNVSISLQPPPLVVSNNSQRPGRQPVPGCTVFVRTSARHDSEAVYQVVAPPEWCSTKNLKNVVKEKISQDIELYATNRSQEELKRDVQRLILEDSETLDDMVAAADFYQSKSSSQAGFVRPPDLEWWADTQIRGLALLRRMASGLDVVVVTSNDVAVDLAEQLHWNKEGTRVATMEHSFLDMLLTNKGLNQVIIDALVKRLVQLESLIPNLEASESMQLCLKLQQKLIQVVNGAQGTFQLPNKRNLNIAKLRAKHLPPLGQHDDASTVARSASERRSMPPKVRDEKLLIQQERERLIRDFTERQEKRIERNRRKARRAEGRLQDGTVVYTAAEMPLKDFLVRSRFMDKVNRTIPRPFVPGVSRPFLKQLNLSKAALDGLQQPFFEDDGRLRRSVVPDIDLSPKHGYINFNNMNCSEERNDKRWQVPLRRHSQVVGKIPSRSVVESILTQEGIVNPAFEAIHDLGLLFGGTEDQSLHHDIARQTSVWVKCRPSVDSALDSANLVPGWEVDRLEYNEAMASAWAPSSILLGLGNSDEVHIGVQKDHVIRSGPDQRQCRIINGEPGEELEICRENDFLVVVSARGCIFTGDFPHAGVNNFIPESAEDALMRDLIVKLDAIMKKHAQDRRSATKAVIEMLCNFPGLNKICRLHCSTELLDTEMRIPKNAIGYFGCLANPPKY